MATPSRSSGVVATACLSLILLLCTCTSTSDAATARQGSSGRNIVVGGEEHWHFGFNYTAWATQAAPFYVGDALVFMYKPAKINGMEVNHNVYRLHSRKAFEQCSFGGGRLLANTTQGNPGFKFVLVQRGKPVYFACSIAQGIHCNEGLMKFWVIPR